MSFTSMGIFPTACAASVWKKTLCLRQISPIRFRGCTTPISLFTAMTEQMAVSGRMAASSSAKSTNPLGFTGRYVTSHPRCSRYRHESRTHLWSVCVVMTCFFRPS